MSRELKWINGFLGGHATMDTPSHSAAEDFQRLHETIPFPLNLHINSIFQFYLVPLTNLIKLNGASQFSKSQATIWFSGFREMQAILPYDFKYWSFTGKKGIASLIRLAVLTYFFLRVVKYSFELLKRVRRQQSGNISEFGNGLDRLVLVRRQIHLSAYQNPFYKRIISNSKKVLFFLPDREQYDDEVVAPLNATILWNAFRRCLLAIIGPNPAGLRIETNGLKVDLTSAFFESCWHFDTWLYDEQLKVIASQVDIKCEVISFEQVSWSAELEKLHFSKINLSHIQFGVFPYYPYPSIGIGSSFYIRSNHVLTKYREIYPARNFGKLDVSVDTFEPVSFIFGQPAALVFATQPYRKDAENRLYRELLTLPAARGMEIKYHPRESKLYPANESISDIYSRDNLVVITRTSSIVVELFSRGIPYICYMDDEDLRLDVGEVAKLGDPVVISEIQDLLNAVRNIDDYVKSFMVWRAQQIAQYV